jgi:hypothetical protein
MMVAEAHTQDFEKKRKPGAGDSDNLVNMRRDGSVNEEHAGSSDEEDDDEQDEQDVLDAEALLRHQRRQEDGEGGDG